MRILHVIHNFHPGGGFRALAALAAQCLEIGPGDSHRLAGLSAGGPASGPDLARRAGLTVLGIPDPADLRAAVADSDVVHLHFWNTPEVYEFLRSDLPPMRLLVTMHVGGEHAPQVITRELVDFADRIQNTGPFGHARPVYAELDPATRAQKIHLTYCPADFRRLGEIRPRPHEGLNVVYVGTVDFVKMHPDFVSLCAAIRTPGARFVVCGGGGAYPELERRAREAGLADRFTFLGRLEDIAPVLETADVFGYPLCERNYSSGELVLQEAAHAGLPAVVFAGGGAGSMIEDGVTGRVVHGAAEYAEAVDRLLSHPGERRRMGDNARDTARRLYAWGRAGRETMDLYADMLRGPKRERRFPSPLPPAEASRGDRAGAWRFVQSLGRAGEDFRTSLAASGLAEGREADRRIAAADPGLAAGNGGIARYLRRHPDDPMLLYWAGLTDLARGEADVALGRFFRAVRLGLDPERGNWHFARAAALLGEPELAREALDDLLRRAPGLRPEAQELVARAARPAAEGAWLKTFLALRGIGDFRRAAVLAFGPLLRQGTREALEQLYRFGLECHRAGLADLAERAYRETASRAELDPDLAAWAHCKSGELLLDRGQIPAANERFAAALALKPDLSRARVLGTPEAAPLRVSIGEDRAPSGFIGIAMDPFDASLWEYHFSRRGPDALRLAVDRQPAADRGAELAGLAARWLAPGGDLTLLVPDPEHMEPAGLEAFVRMFPGPRLHLERARA